MLLQACRDLLINPGMQWVEHVRVQLHGAVLANDVQTISQHVLHSS